MQMYIKPTKPNTLPSESAAGRYKLYPNSPYAYTCGLFGQLVRVRGSFPQVVTRKTEKPCAQGFSVFARS
jgi:hypothetical protein